MKHCCEEKQPIQNKPLSLYTVLSKYYSVFGVQKAVHQIIYDNHDKRHYSELTMIVIIYNYSPKRMKFIKV